MFGRSATAKFADRFDFKEFNLTVKKIKKMIIQTRLILEYL
jgi:hypothetical protein